MNRTGEKGQPWWSPNSAETSLTYYQQCSVQLLVLNLTHHHVEHLSNLVVDFIKDLQFWVFLSFFFFFSIKFTICIAKHIVALLRPYSFQAQAHYLCCTSS